MWNNPPGTWPRSSHLDFLITRVTTAVQPENNYALHIEIAEYINKKKANRYIRILVIHRNVKPILGCPVHEKLRCSSCRQ